MAIPATLTMLGQSLYNIIDTIFVSGINPDALSGVCICFPIDMVISALGVGTGVGVSSCMSRALGQSKNQNAKEYIVNSFFISLIFGLLFALIGIFGTQFFVSQFSQEALIQNYAINYMWTTSTFSVFMIAGLIGTSILQGYGKMKTAMIGQLVGVVLNICLDPIFIYGLGPIPKLDTLGAALSTVTASAISSIVILLCIFSKKDNVFTWTKQDLNLNIKAIKEILIIGIPVSMVTIITSITTGLLNKILIGYSPKVVAAYGIFLKVNSFVCLPIFGIIRASSSILGYSFGKNNISRYKETIKFSSLYGCAFYSVGMILFLLFPSVIASWFNPDEELMRITVNCFRTICWTFPIAGISIPLSNCFNPAGKSLYSLTSAFLRQLVFLVPSVFMLGQIWGIDSVWWAFIIADSLNLIVVIFMCKHLFVKWTTSSVATSDSKNK